MFNDKQKAKLFARVASDGCSVTDGLESVRTHIANQTGIENREQLNNILGYCLTRVVLQNEISEVIWEAAGRERG